MTNRSISVPQHRLFLYIREKTPDHISYVNELSALLNLSIDSVYRRIRGEKPLLLNEVFKICNHYRISFDDFFSLNDEHISIKSPLKAEHKFTLEAWLDSLLKTVQQMVDQPTSMLKIVSQELSCFHFFSNKTLALFKLSYWDSIILGNGNGQKFSLQKPAQYLEPLLEKALQIGHLFSRVKRLEIWNCNVFDGVLHQVEQAVKSNKLEMSEKRLVLDNLLKIVTSKEDQLEKHHIGSNADNRYDLFINETDKLENLLVSEATESLSFLQYNEFWGWLTTDDSELNNSFSNLFNHYRSRSKPYGEISEGRRKIAFNMLKEKISEHY